jgi:acyl-CoA thioesterase I
MIRRALLLFLALCLAPAAAGASAKTVMVYGDSLSASYGVPREQGWVSLLAQRMQEEGLDYSVVNASVSGETTAGGRRRIDEALKTHRPSVVVIELGANDGLRGQPPETMRRNLEAMIEACRRAGARVLLIGMRLPPNYGPDYISRFHQTFIDVARKHRLPVVPFLFEGFADNRAYFQPDTVHPTARAQPLMLDTVWPALKPLLERK